MKKIAKFRPLIIVVGILLLLSSPFIHHFINVHEILSSDESVVFSLILGIIGFFAIVVPAISYAEGFDE